MRKLIVVLLICVGVPVLAWYAWLFYATKDSRRFDAASFVVTYHDRPEICDIRRGALGTPHQLSCSDVIAYVAELKLPAASTFGISDFGDHGAEISALTSKLQMAGYRSVGIRRVEFITRPP